MNNNWFRIRWHEGRRGNAIYLMFALTLVNFILISYRFLIEEENYSNGLFLDLWIFGVIFMVTYFPISIIIGFWHRKTQLSMDNSIKFMENPLYSRMFRTMLDVQTGKASEEEIKRIREMLQKIEKNN